MLLGGEQAIDFPQMPAPSHMLLNSIELPARPESVKLARGWIGEQLGFFSSAHTVMLDETVGEIVIPEASHSDMADDWIRESAILIGSEAVTNSIRHGAKKPRSADHADPSIRVDVALESSSDPERDGRVLLLVHNEGGRMGRQRPRSANSEGNRGLFLAAAFTDRMGYDREIVSLRRPNGRHVARRNTVVWFELPHSDSAA